MRLVVSGATPVSSLTISSTLRPATVSPFFCMYSRHAASICLPVDANGPVSGRINPILNGSAATASADVPGGQRGSAGLQARGGAEDRCGAALVLLD